ncbi:autotransporter domain-containing protein [uncultured Phascolarctobacterium sp.]|uniref:autotransporter domain-containing protein n=2 Tax=uncultured Phascolarctobacterium sp. TaxID=512296 RepID=UPI0026172894|nr:autotransporter outer membrane beta-barrel domain-containing protein [uncultured Phascolarctobacterium sp.]
MKESWSKKIKSRSWHSKLAVAVTAGLLAGLYVPSGFAAEYKQGMTGTINDNQWLKSAAVTKADDGTIVYDFNENTTFTVDNEAGLGLSAGLFGSADADKVTINMNDNTLYINASSGDYGNSVSAGINIDDGDIVVINGDVDITSHGGSCFSSGIAVQRAGAGEGREFTHLTINGDLTMRSDDPLNPWGITSENIHGGYGPGGSASADAPNYKGARWAPAGIDLQMAGGSIIDINGNVDLAVAGSAVKVDPYYSQSGIDDYDVATINLNGGTVNIETPESSDETYYALANYGGTINVNMNGDQAGTNDVNVKGNIIVMKDDNGSGEPYFYQNGRINLALTTDKSSWTGVVDNSGSKQAGEINLFLQNGAQWNHESLSKTNGLQVQNMPDPSIDHYGKYDGVSHVYNLSGGNDAANAGYILQNDTAKIAIDNYSGHTVVVYEHTNDGTQTGYYTAGDITIQNASAGSGIVLSTDNSGITMSDSDMVAKVLNALAGKLTYRAFTEGETNLAGKVQIADGLTSSSVAATVGEIVFDASTGKGTNTDGGTKPTPPISKTEFTSAITGNAATDTEYAEAGIIQADGSYKFTEDSTINVTGNSAIASVDDIAISAEGKVLTLTSDNKVIAGGTQNMTIRAKQLNISGKDNGIQFLSVSADKVAKGVIDADVAVNATGSMYVYGIDARGNSDVTINGDVSIKGADESNPWGVVSNMVPSMAYGLYAGANFASGTSGKLTVNGDVDIAAKGSGIFADHTDALINVNGGGTVKVDTGSSGIYALGTASGTVNMNMNVNKTAAADNKVNIFGNLGVLNTNVSNKNDTAKESVINLGLSTADSKLNGVIFNNYTESNNSNGYYGKVNLFVKNGAVWTNEVYGKVAATFKGSTVENFVGGSDADKAGNIFQKDSNNLTFNNYSGYTNIYYAHENSGENSTDYTAGDTIVKHAAEGSGISLITDNSGITISDQDQVNSVLNALAGKLTYKNYTTGEDNLKGYVKIADGLTASSAALTTGDITFSKDTGKGSYEAGSGETPEPGDKTEFTTQITGDAQADVEYKGAGVIQADGTYKFDKDVSITTSGAAITGNDYNIDASGHMVNISAGNNGIMGGNKTITVGKLNIEAKSSGRTEGISVGGQGETDAENRLTINGDTNINVKGKGYTLGVYTAGAGELIINGNVTMKGEDGSWGVDVNGGSVPGYYNISGLYAGSNYSIQKGSHIEVNGAVDLAVNGTGVLANGGKATIDLNGGGTILTNKENSGHYALISQSGHINMNVKKDEHGNVVSAGDNKVNVYGNLGVMNGSVHPNEPDKTTSINLGLSTSDSEWVGIIANNFTEKQIADGWKGEVNLYLSNGASWTNEAYGTAYSKFAGSTVENFVGGASADKAGNIFQKDSNNLTFNNYSGYTNIYYAHENSGENSTDYTAGDTIVKHAAEGSGISLITDNSGITISDQDQVNSVLNALAGKLTYKNYTTGEDNLKGYVKIADGLTASSAALTTGDITFSKDTGKGSYEAGSGETPEPGDKTEFTTQITGDAQADVEYKGAGVIQADGTYKFDKDVSITTSGAAITGNDYNIDATGHIINISAVNNGVMGGNKTITADKLNVEVRSSGRVQGIAGGNNVVINADVNVMAKSSGNGAYALGTYFTGTNTLTVNGNLSMKDENGSWGVTNGDASGGYYRTSGLYAGSNYTIQKGGTITVNGDVDLAINGTGIFANGGASTVDINGGGTILTNKENSSHYALISQSGHINMNVKKDGQGKVTSAGDSTVKIYGNLGVMNGSVHPNEPDKTTDINLGLSTKDSVLQGVIVNNFTESQVKNGWTGEVNMYMSNGATWINEAYGGTNSNFAGSTVENFVGGSDAAHAGYVIQKDSNPLTFNNYSGHAVIVYEHANAGTSLDDYAAGNTVINKATAGSGIKLSTDNSNIDMNSKDAVEATLNALAQKLQYMGNAVSQEELMLLAEENNSNGLKAEVEIASGLTASSTSQKVGEIVFDSAGNGSYVAGSVTDGSGDNPGGDVEIGDYESDIMKGARSAMMTSMLSWRDNAADIYSRGTAVRDGAEEGAWARSFGGKAKYDGSSTSMENSYWAGQVGYDRMLANGWTLGAAIDYRDGNATYLNGGKGDNKLYSFGIYASKDLGDNAYLDMAVKAGKVENEYSVYNIIGQKLDGDYSTRGYSVSAQYSKRFGEETKGYVEPQLQLTWSHLDSESYNTHSGNNVMNIRQDAFNSFVGRIGVQTGVETERGGLFAKLSVAHEFSGDVEGSYNANDGGLKTTKYDLGGTWSELTLGGSYKLSKCSNFYADITRSLSGDYQHQWKLNAGLNFSF